MRTTYHGRVVAFQDGQYKQIVVQNLDEPENSWDRYVMLTICPNWQGSIPKVQEQGFFEFEEVGVKTPSELSRNATERGGHTDLMLEKIIQDGELTISVHLRD